MPEGEATLEDPRRNHRLAVAIPAALLLGVSGFFADTIVLRPDGTHSSLIGIEGVRTLVLAVIALLVVYFAAQPNKPDPRIAQAIMLAGAIVAIVVSLERFITLNDNPVQVPGVAPYLQILAAVGLLVLRWKRSLWPTSRWIIEAREAAAARTQSRRRQ